MRVEMKNIVIRTLIVLASSVLPLSSQGVTFGTAYEHRTGSPSVPVVTLSGPSSAAVGQSVSVTANATVGSGATASYQWLATGGSFSGTANSASVTWTPPANSQGRSYTIYCTVGDGLGRIASASLPILVSGSGGSGCAMAPGVPMFYDPGMWSDTPSISLCWQPMPTAVSYILQQSVTTDFANPISTTYSAPAPSVTLTNQNNGVYYFRVKAKNDCGESTWSNMVSFEVRANHAPNAPVAVTPPTGNTGISRTPLLQWTCSDPEGDLLDYAVEWGTDSANMYFIQGYGSTNQYVAQLPIGWTLRPSQKYYWRVRARDERGATTIGPLWYFTTNDLSADLVPIGIQVTGAMANGSVVTVDVTVQNQGYLPYDGNGRMRYYYSAIPDALQGEFSSSWRGIPPLQPGATAVVSTDLRISNLLAGASFLVANIDNYAASSELDTSNNTISHAVNYTDTTAPVISYLALQGASGNIFRTNNAYTIAFTVQDDIAPTVVDLSFSTDNGSTWSPIASNYPILNNGGGNSYRWTIPASAPLNNNFKVRVTAHDGASNVTTSVIGPYSLIDGSTPTVTLTSPEAGDVWKLGETRTITWAASSPNGIKRISLSYSYSANQGLPLVSLTGNPGTYSWTLPSAASYASNSATIRLFMEDNNGNYTTVDSPIFSVVDAAQPPPAPWQGPSRITTVPTVSTSWTGQDDSSPVLAVDAQGNQHLVYVYSESDGSKLYSDINKPTGGVRYTTKLFYMKKTAGVWSQPTTLRVAPPYESDWTEAGAKIGFTDMTMNLDANGFPHVAWSEGPSSAGSLKEIQYCYFNGSSWSTPVNVSNNSRTREFTWGTLPYAPGMATVGNRVRILANSGTQVYAMGFSYYKRLYRFDPTTSSWTQLADSPSGGSVSDLCGLNGKVYAISDNGEFHAFQESSQTWSTLASAPVFGVGARMVVYGSKIYVFGANRGNSVQIYNPATNGWTTGAPMPIAMGYSGLRVQDAIYVFGGESDTQRGLSDVLRYDPVANTWTTKAPMGFAKGCIGGGDNYFGNRTYIVSNDAGLLGSANIEAVDHRLNLLALPSGRLPNRMVSAATSGYGGKLFVMDGTTFVVGTLNGTQDDDPTVSFHPRIAINNGVVSIYWLDGERELGVDGRTSPIRNGTRSIYSRSFTPATQTWGSITTLLPNVLQKFDLAQVGGTLNLVASYHDTTTNTDAIGHLVNTGSAWSTPVKVADGVGPVTSLSLAATPAGNLSLVYTADAANRNLLFTSWAGGSWSQPAVVHTRSSSSQILDAKVCVGANGTPGVLFSGFTTGTGYFLNLLAKNALGKWSKVASAVPTSQDPGTFSGAVAPGTNTLDVVYSALYSGHSEIFENSASLAIDFTEPLITLEGIPQGATLQAGQPVAMSWTASDDTAVTSVDLKYSVDGGTTFTSIASGLSASDQYVWTVPALASTKGMVVASARDAAGNVGSGASPQFTINAPISYSLTVIKMGAGTGSVTSSPSVLNCGTVCTAQFGAPTQVTLTALANSGSRFTGWTGAITGSGAGVVNVTGDLVVYATFEDNTFPIAVTLGGTGTGTVVADPVGLNVTTGTGIARYPSGTQLSLTATAGEGSTFVGWSGSGLGSVSLTNPLGVLLEGSKAYIANFSAQILSVNVRAKVGGRVVPEGAISVFYGQGLDFQIITDPGYQIDQILVGGVPQPVSALFSLASIKTNKDVVITFKMK